MTQSDMDYLLSRFGKAFIAAGNSLLASSGSGTTAPDSTEDGATSNGDGSQADPEPIVVDNSPALGEVGVIASRAPLRTQPTKDIDIDLGRLLEGERVPLDAISEDNNWYRVDIRNFAGVHTIPDHATYGWGEASNFEIIKLN